MEQAGNQHVKADFVCFSPSLPQEGCLIKSTMEIDVATNRAFFFFFSGELVVKHLSSHHYMYLLKIRTFSYIATIQLSHSNLTLT